MWGHAPSGGGKRPCDSARARGAGGAPAASAAQLVDKGAAEGRGRVGRPTFGKEAAEGGGGSAVGVGIGVGGLVRQLRLEVEIVVVVGVAVGGAAVTGMGQRRGVGEGRGVGR